MRKAEDFKGFFVSQSIGDDCYPEKDRIGRKKNPSRGLGLNPPLEEGGGDMRSLPQRDKQWN